MNESSGAPTVTVGPDGGDFRSIGTAVAAVGAGSRIVVKPGTYREAIEVDRDVEIIGEGGAVIEGKGPTAISINEGTRVLLTGLHVRPGGGIRGLFARVKGEGDLPTILISGDVVIEACDITGAKSSAVGVLGGRFEFRRSTIHDGFGAGIDAVGYRATSGLIEDCDITGFEQAAVVIRGAATELNVRGGVIHDGAGNGVMVSHEARGEFSGVEIARQRMPAIHAMDAGTTIVVDHCRIHDGGDNGVTIVEGATAEIRNSEFFANEDEIGVAGQDAIALVQNCHLHDGRGYGVGVIEGGDATIEDSRIERATRAGLYAEGLGSRLTARRNRIVDSQGWGVVYGSGSDGAATDNEIVGNLLGGLAISGDDTRPEVAANAIRDNGGLAGGLILNGARPRIHHNQVSAASPWRVKKSQPTIKSETDDGPWREPKAPPIDASRPTVGARVGVGEGPISMAIDEGGAPWVACPGSSAVCRIDPASTRVDLVIETTHPDDATLETGPTAVAFGDSALWLACGVVRSEGELEAPLVEKRSPTDGALLGTAVLDAGLPTAILHAFGSIWVATGEPNALVRIGSDRLEILATLPLDAAANNLVQAAGSVWVALPDTSTVLRIDAETTAVRSRIRVPAVGQIATGPHGLWVSTFDSRSAHGEIYRIDDSTDRPIAGGVRSLGSNAIAVDASGIWTAPLGRIVRYDPRSRQVTANIEIGTLALRLAPGHGTIWALYPFTIGFRSDEGAPGTVVRIDI